MKTFKILIILPLVLVPFVTHAQKFTKVKPNGDCSAVILNRQTSKKSTDSVIISGFVKGCAKGEIVVGAPIKIMDKDSLIASGATDKKGYYSFKVPGGIYEVSCWAMGIGDIDSGYLVFRAGEIIKLDLFLHQSKPLE